jgi:hypothetical protein
MEVALGQSVVPDDASLGFYFLDLTAGEARDIFDEYGPPVQATEATIDQSLVDLGLITTATVANPELWYDCDTESPPAAATVLPDAPVIVLADAETWIVEVRRFGSAWVPLVEGRAGQAMQVASPEGVSTVPWEVRTQPSPARVCEPG